MNAEDRAEQRINEHERELRQAYLEWLQAVETLGWELVTLKSLAEGKPSITLESFEQRYASTIALATTRICLLDTDPVGHKLVNETSQSFRERMMNVCNPTTPRELRVRLSIEITDWLDTVFDRVNERFTGIKPTTKHPSP